MSSVAPFVTQMLRQQAAAEEQRRMVKDAVAGQAASSIMRQIAMGEIQQEMASEARTGRALEAAAGAESRRSVSKSRLEAQKELDEKQKLLGLIGGAADATGALGAYFIEKNATDKAQAEAAFQKRMALSAMNPQVDDMSQFNPEDIEALRLCQKPKQEQMQTQWCLTLQKFHLKRQLLRPFLGLMTPFLATRECTRLTQSGE